MRRVVLAVGVLCAVGVTGRGTAQNGAPNAMPGQVVGGYRGQVNPVGKQLPQAAPQAGVPVAENALQRPYDPNKPYDAFKGTGIDPKTVLAPLSAPDGKLIAPPDALDQLSDRIRAIFGGNKAAPPRPAYTPGVTRRGQLRNEHMWRRD